MGFSASVAAMGLNVPWAEDALWREARGDVQVYTLLKGVIARESAWNPGAFRYEPGVNDASYGLMQVLLSTAKGALGNPNLTPSDLFIPDINIAAGAAYLRFQLTRYGDARRAVSAYNCGSECLTRATSFWPNGNYPYVDDVLTYQNWYLNNLPATAATEPVTDTPSSSPEIVATEWTGEVELAGVGIGLLVLGAAAFFMMRKR